MDPQPAATAPDVVARSGLDGANVCGDPGWRCAGRSWRKRDQAILRQRGRENVVRSTYAFESRAAAPIVAPTNAPIAVPIRPNSEPTNAPTVAPIAAPEIASVSRSLGVVIARSPRQLETPQERSIRWRWRKATIQLFPRLPPQPHFFPFASGHKNPERPGIGSVSRCTFSRPAMRAAPPKISWVRRLSWSFVRPSAKSFDVS